MSQKEEYLKHIDELNKLSKNELIFKLLQLSNEFNDLSKSSKELEDFLELENQCLIKENKELSEKLSFMNSKEAEQKNHETDQHNKDMERIRELEIENDTLINELRSTKNEMETINEKLEIMQLDVTQLVDENTYLRTINEQLSNSIQKFKVNLTKASLGLFNRDKLKVSKYKTPPVV